MRTNIRSNKNLHIETLRGFAIILVVMGHIIGSTPDGGMKIDFPSPWRYLYLWIDFIQMPLFTAIAGWVYGLKLLKKEYFSSFLKKKTFRLLVPMVTVGTLYFTVQYLIPGTNSKGSWTEIWKIYLFPYTIYWYLPSLFIMFLLQGIIDINGWANSLSGWIKCFIGIYLLMILQSTCIPNNIPNLFSFKGALMQFPYFITGVGICRFSKEISSKWVKTSCLIAVCIGLLLLQIDWFYSLHNNTIYKITQPLWAICSLYFILRSSVTNNFLIRIGSYAYTIYLFHGFGTAGGRIILTKSGVHSEIIIFLFALFIAIFIPIILERILKKWEITRMLFLGESVVSSTPIQRTGQ